jgi:phosphate transport system ATP-binding protein
LTVAARSAPYATRVVSQSLPSTEPAAATGLRVAGLSAFYDDTAAVKSLSLDVPANKITAIIGPSGCGKSTFVRCLNRMHEEISGARVEGEVTLGGVDIYGEDIDVVEVRRAIGMVFQKPNPFPTQSIFDNVAAGLRYQRLGNRRELATPVHQALRAAALWAEVKPRLDRPALELSGGQQQRLCIARALAVDPDVLLLDEPCSSLDPVATHRIEELLIDLKEQVTIVLVTHNMQQAARVADFTAFMLDGELIEVGPSDMIFTGPSDQRTEDYVSGRFG